MPGAPGDRVSLGGMNATALSHCWWVTWALAPIEGPASPPAAGTPFTRPCLLAGSPFASGRRTW